MTKQTLIRLTAAGCVAIVVFVLLLPRLFGSSSVRTWLLDQVLAPQGIEAKIDGVSVGWFRSTRVRGVSIGPVGRPPVLKASKIISDRTLVSALLEGVDMGVLSIVDPEVHVWMDRETSNLEFPQIESTSSTHDASNDTSQSEPKTLKVQVTGARLFVKTPAMAKEANVFSSANLNCTLRQDATKRTLLIAPGRVIDYATISPELCAGGFKFILPILSDATWTKGAFSLDLDACVIDLDNPRESLISGKLLVHGIEAGIRNELLATASNRLSQLLGNEGFDTVVLADNSEIEFQVRDGAVWHEGVEFGLPRVSEDLVVRTSGSVTFDESLDLSVEIPMPLHLIANGPIAQALNEKTVTLHATGTLQKPQVQIADEDFIAKLFSGIGGQLAEEERPIESIVKGFRDGIRGEDDREAVGDEVKTPLLDRLRDRMEQRDGPLRRLFGNGDQ